MFTCHWHYGVLSFIGSVSTNLLLTVFKLLQSPNLTLRLPVAYLEYILQGGIHAHVEPLAVDVNTHVVAHVLRRSAVPTRILIDQCLERKATLKSSSADRSTQPRQYSMSSERTGQNTRVRIQYQAGSFGVHLPSASPFGAPNLSASHSKRSRWANSRSSAAVPGARGRGRQNALTLVYWAISRCRSVWTRLPGIAAMSSIPRPPTSRATTASFGFRGHGLAG